MLYYIPNNLLTDVPEGVKAAWDLPLKCQGGRPGFVFELTDAATSETVLTLADFVANSCNPSVPTPVLRVVLPNRQMIVIIGGGTEGYRYYDLHPANAFDDLKRNGKKVRNTTITIECGIEAVPERFADAWNKVTRRAVLCSKALGEGVEELNGRLESLLEVRNAIELSLEFAEQSAPDDDQQPAEPQSEASEPVETVVVEPVEVEHDGVVDVELAETSETIPIVETESDDCQQYVGMWAFGSARVYVCTDGTVWEHFDHHDSAYESWVRQETPCGAAATVYDTFANRGWIHVSRDATDDVPRFVTDNGAAKPGTVCADDFERGWRYDGLSAVTRDYAAVPAPRAVESAPTLPAECSAVTQEIPEVPPQTNEDAQVLQVAEHVIPACVTLKEYELTRDVPRKRCKQFRDARGRKCAYVVQADTGAFILWRSWYKHEDAEMDAAVRAYYAQVA